MGLAATKQEAFWEACGFGNKEKVRRFIQEGIDINWVSYTHNSCAIHVASQGKKEIVQMLLDAHCKVDARDDRGNLALHHAAMKGHADIVQMLIDAKSDIDAQDKNGWTPLISASYFCQPEVVEVLVGNKCSVDVQNKDLRSALHEACRSQSTDEDGLYKISKLLIEAGCDINSKSSDAGEADFTPLMFSAYHGHPKVAKALIDSKCDINAQGSNQWTALHWAADRSNLEVIHVLLNAGLDPLIPGRRGELARDRAQSNDIREALDEATKTRNKDVNCVSLRSQTSEAQLKQISHEIQTTAEDHEILVRQQREKHLMSVSTTSSLSSDRDRSRSIDHKLSSVDDPTSPTNDDGCSIDEEDGDDKDRDDIDPESSSKIVRSVDEEEDCTANGQVERDDNDVAVNGISVRTTSSSEEIMSN